MKFDSVPRLLGVLAAAAILVGLPTASARAVDPECSGAIGDPPVYQGCQLKLGFLLGTLRFCTPQFDIDGDPIPSGAMASCTVELDGVRLVEPVTEPGKVFVVEVQGKNPGHVIRAWCTTAEGLDGPAWQSDLCFPAKQPKEPHLR